MSTSKYKRPTSIDCTILFADVAGSTQMYERLGDLVAQAAISKCQRWMADIIRRHGGSVIKEIGDETMSRFADADDAVTAACEIQRDLSSKKIDLTVPIEIRIGLHHGTVILQKGDVFGDAVNVAARMRDIARGGQIITTEETVHTLSQPLADRARHFDRTRLKGKTEPVSIYDVVWDRQATITSISMAFGPAKPHPKRNSLCLRLGDIEVAMAADVTTITLGRDTRCDIVIDEHHVSRNHAVIFFQRENFFLEDQSTNGTYVRTDDGNVLYLRRERSPLWGSGTISLGVPLSEAAAELIHFQCEW